MSDTKFACPVCWEAVEGHVKLMEHIRAHKPEELVECLVQQAVGAYYRE